MNWDDLRIFIAVMRSGSLSEAARQLHIDHATVARRITALEEALGVKLFDRMPRGYLPTVEADRIAAEAGAIERSVLAVQRLAAGSDAMLGGTVRVSASPVVASHFLAGRFAAFRKAHPQVEIELLGQAELVQLDRNEADCAVRLSRPEEGDLLLRKVGVLGYGLYGARDYLDRTAEADWVFCGYDAALAHVPQQLWLAEVAAGRPFAFRTNDLASLFQAVRSGIGLSAIPHFMVADVPDMVCLARSERAARDIWLVAHRDVARAPRVRAVLDYLAVILGELRQ
ncbi:LysR family transcriptional regulator [Kaistia dalseonensis]|uniref:DNA-binding transcriptional LysR family regulator n=1 Tax=Kaistia dalseonensis TaxID=410840 RepID=A0ABU0H714_9HYPH|nr:LysR family transcriptional regulator [Kaistia dalseonensis]MCX5495485.1 LysR family transcriptional regulator [Kaistia dalseonensis]MDQ0438076.1 DNA-binding transcriptional LysR family regulator [Kaistia dalseonensis]